jgi:hypothetical protein
MIVSISLCSATNFLDGEANSDGFDTSSQCRDVDRLTNLTFAGELSATQKKA